jgi:phosphorylcholine metabolism protein LicD
MGKVSRKNVIKNIFIVVLSIFLCLIIVCLYFVKYYTLKNKQKKIDKKLFKENLIELMSDIYAKTSKHNIDIWINYGTLLGQYRENKIIDHDYDIDLATMENNYHLIKQILDYEKYWITPVNFLGYKFIKVMNRETGVYLDIDFYRIQKNNLRICMPSFLNKPNERKYDRTFVFPLRQVMFESVNVQIPNKPEKILPRYYGPTFMTPDK